MEGTASLWESIAKEFLESLIPERREDTGEYGSVIFVQRLLYRHYGISLGNGRVIHYAPEKDEEIASICEADMEDFLQGATSYVVCHFPKEYGAPEEERRSARSLFQSDCYPADDMRDFMRGIMREYKKQRYHLYTPEETVERARSRLGERNYNLIFNNCEHFAVWCKTNISESYQVERLVDFVTGKIPLG